MVDGKLPLKLPIWILSDVSAKNVQVECELFHPLLPSLLLTLLMDMADLVTDMGEVKHPAQSGVKAQRGIEF